MQPSKAWRAKKNLQTAVSENIKSSPSLSSAKLMKHFKKCHTWQQKRDWLKKQGLCFSLCVSHTHTHTHLHYIPVDRYSQSEVLFCCVCVPAAASSSIKQLPSELTLLCWGPDTTAILALLGTAGYRCLKGAYHRFYTLRPDIWYQAALWEMWDKGFFLSLTHSGD